MSYTAIVDGSTLSREINNPQWRVIDVRFSLNDTERGRRDYHVGHIPGAFYAHLDEDLCGAIHPERTGRHPLPEVQTFAEKLSGWGTDGKSQVVVYDDMGGAIAARLWWMLNWLGHKKVALLDGGWQTWKKEKHPVSAKQSAIDRRLFLPRSDPSLLATAEEIEQIHTDSTYRLLDSRAEERYRGESEPIDPVAGRIPGAVSAPWAENLDNAGLFLPADVLRKKYEALIGDIPPSHVICYCGSGVTAALNLVAMAHAGIGPACLYAGSWSEWITNPDRPVMTDRSIV